MGVTFGGRSCIDPLELLETCRRCEPPIPTAPWAGRINSFRTQLGPEPARGYVAMSQANLKALGNLNASFTLKFRDDQNNTVSIPNLYVAHAEAIAPSYAADSTMPYFLTLVDRRAIWTMSVIDQAFNLPACPGSLAYLAPTTNSGIAWTWSAMIQAIWNAISATFPAFPGLPFVPDGTPGGFNYFASNAWAALNDALARIACAFRLDPFTGAVSIVRLGNANAAGAAVLKKLAGQQQLIWNDYENEPVVTRLPSNVCVRFRKQPRPIDGTSEWYVIENGDSTGGNKGAAAQSAVMLDDDEPALMISGVSTPANSAALITRATERTKDYFRKLESFNNRNRYIWMGIQPTVAQVLGSQFVEIAWEERGDGFRTSSAVPGPTIPLKCSRHGGPTSNSRRSRMRPVGSTSAVVPANSCRPGFLVPKCCSA